MMFASPTNVVTVDATILHSSDVIIVLLTNLHVANATSKTTGKVCVALPIKKHPTKQEHPVVTATDLAPDLVTKKGK